jgi:hypothetical protein
MKPFGALQDEYSPFRRARAGISRSRPSRTKNMTTARSRVPIGVAESHTASKAVTCSAPTPRGSPRRKDDHAQRRRR